MTMIKVLFRNLGLFLGMTWSSWRAACRVGWLQGQTESERSLRLGWQEERHNTRRRDEEELSPSIVVTYYTATYMQGKSATILQYMEELK